MQEALAMRMGQEIRRGGVGIERGLIEIARNRKETLRPEEPAIGNLRQPARAKKRKVNGLMTMAVNPVENRTTTQAIS